MSVQSQTLENFNKAVNVLQNPRVPRWFNGLRATGLSHFSSQGVPTTNVEDWKYTNLQNLTRRTFQISPIDRSVKAEVWQDYVNPDEINIVTVNGYFSKELSNLKLLPPGIRVATILESVIENETDIQGFLTKYNDCEKSAFISLNEAIHQGGLYVRVADQTVFEPLIHIVHLTTAAMENVVYAPRTLISMGKSSEARVLESHLAPISGLAYWTNALTDHFLAENSVLHYSKSQRESLKAFHIGQTRVWQERNSTFDGFSFMTGGGITRNNVDVVLNGEGASTTLNALYSIFGDQHVDNHTSIDHRVPHCTSNQLYKGILNESSRAVFNGKIFVQPIAQQTNSYQLNKNLLLGKKCRVDTKPQLEIFADDVKCTHGATIGQLDEHEMFYLKTRCIPKRIATQLLAHGFVDDVLNTLGNASIHQKIDFLMKSFYNTLT